MEDRMSFDYFKQFTRFIINSDLYVAFVAIGLGLVTYVAYSLPFRDFTPLVIIFFTTWSIYTINRQTDQEFDAINLPNRTEFVKNHGQKTLLFSLLGLFLAFSLAVLHSALTILVTLLAFLSGYFYSYPFLHFGRFRDFLVIKNIGVGLIYGFLALIVPVYFGIESLMFMFALFILFFIRFFLISSFFDLRDIAGDAHAGIKTIPLALGEANSKLAFHALNVLPLLIFIPLAYGGVIPVSFLLICFLLLVYGGIYLFGLRLGLSMEFLCMVVADAEAFVVGLVLIIARVSGFL